MLLVLGGSALAELLLYGVAGLWRVRKRAVPVLVVATAFSSSAIALWRPSVMSGLFALLGMYRVLNVVRVAEGRMHERYLRHVALRTSLVLLVLQAATGGVWLVWYQLQLATHPLWTVLGLVQFLCAAVLLLSTIRRLKHTRLQPSRKQYSDAQLPSITVAIPARNETEDLQRCLESIIASNYPKLEIIVLDDCSQLKRTPEIIRSFAHDGVRFVRGAEPKDTWLPKNQAYQRLTQEASGEFILFCGADARFEPAAIRKLMTTLLDRHKNMASVLPQHQPRVGGGFAVLQAMRYWWELVPPRRLFNRPPVMSSCWVIAKKSLKAVGGFEAVTRSIVPEAYFAKQLIAQDGYSFVRSDALLGITSVKSTADQRQTAIRTRYPQLHRRPEQVFAASLLEFLLLVLPFVLAVAGFWLAIGTVAHALALASSGLLTLAYGLIAAATRLNNWWMSLVAFPVVVLADLAMLHYSMWKYEFSEVFWKERNICIPAMHVVPHLPRL